jgi:hypothetical protein
MEENLNQTELSSLDKFKRRLDRQGGSQSDFKSTILPAKDFKVNKGWGDDDLTAADYRPAVAKKTNTFLWRLFWVSSLFFLATLVVAIYVLFFSTNIISGNNINILIKGPAQIRSGDELNLQITVINKNKVKLTEVSFAITYPTGTMDPLVTNQELPMRREKMADLGPGQTAEVASRAVVFGGQNTTQEIKIVMSYHIPESNALFTKEKTYTVQIGSSSLDLRLGLPTDINVGKEFTGTLKVVSNAQSLLRNATIKFEWPAGFNFKTSDPAPVSGDNIWFLGDLVPGTEREINFTGSLTGQSGDVKSFKILAGLASGGGRDPMSTEYGNLFQTVNLRKDFVTAGIYLADESGRDPLIFPGGNFTGDIAWINNLSDKIINGNFDLKVNGALINKRKVQAENGYYDSINNLIFWDERTVAGLKQIPPDEGGQTSFSIGLLPLASGAIAHNSEIKLDLTFRGTRIVGDNQTEDVVTETSKTLKISTMASLKIDGTYQIGPFKNIGPLPPKVGKETTYTINWAVANTANDLGNVVVKTILPSSVKWLNNISPLDEKVVYNQTSGEVVWNLDTVLAGTGSDLPVRKVSFQVSLLPSLSQVGKMSDLTGNITLTGRDTFTGAIINRNLPAINTLITSDPNFTNGQEKVTE